MLGYIKKYVFNFSKFIMSFFCVDFIFNIVFKKESPHCLNISSYKKYKK